LPPAKTPTGERFDARIAGGEAPSLKKVAHIFTTD